MSLPVLFAFLGPLSDPDFDIVEDYYPTPDIIEVLTGPKYLVVCTATQDKLQIIDFLEEKQGDVTIAKKINRYEPVKAQIKLKKHGVSESIQIQKTNLFLSRPSTTAKGYAAVPIYNLITRKEMWYFPIETKYKRKLLPHEVADILTVV